MFLPIGCKIEAFTITAQIEKAKEYCIYEVSSEFDKSFFAAEFFPEDICKRDEQTGYIIPSAECEFEFKNRLKDFTQKLNMLKSPGNAQLIKIYRAIREDRDNFICLYYMPEGRPLKAYLAAEGGRLGYKQAFEMLLPMTDALSRLSAYNIYFKINEDNLYVNAFGSIEHAGFMAAEYNENFAAEDISSVLYYLITGKSYVETLAKPSETGAMLPRSLDELLFESMFYNVQYESLGEFLTKVKDSVLFDADMAEVSSGVINNGRKLAALIDEPKGGPASSAPPQESMPYIPPMQEYTSSAPPIPESAPVAPSAPEYGNMVSYPAYSPTAVDYNSNLPPSSVYGAQGIPAMPVYNSQEKTDIPATPEMRPEIATSGHEGAYGAQPVYSTYGRPAEFPQKASSAPGGAMYSSGQPYNANVAPAKKSNKGLIWGCGIGCGCICILAIAVVVFALLSFRSFSGSSANFPILIEEIPIGELGEYSLYREHELPEYDLPIYYAANTYYDNENISLDGTACIYNGHVYYRGYIEGAGWVLAESPLDDLDSINILFHTMPAYIVAHNDYLYYCDVYNDYRIFRMYIGEDRNHESYEAMSLNNERSAKIQVDDNYVYFVSLMDNQQVYAIDIETMESELLISRSVYWMADYGNKILYNADDGLFALDKDSGRNKKLNISDYAYLQGEADQDGEYIYYFNVFDERLERVDINGANEPEGIRDFGYSDFVVEDGYLYYINDVDYTLNRMNIEAGEDENLNIDPEVFEVSGDYIIYLDYYDDSLYIYNLLTGETAAMYEGEPDYNLGF